MAIDTAAKRFSMMGLATPVSNFVITDGVSGVSASERATFLGLYSGIPLDNGATAFVSDTFDGTGTLGAHWSNYDNSGGGVTPIGRVSNYFEGVVADNTGNQTTWFDTAQGRYTYQTVEVPASGTDTYIALGVGVGPNTSSPTDNLSYASFQYSFCGLMVHDDNLSTATSMFMVVGHRGSNDQSTIEIKGTTAGTSTVASPAGTDVFGTGVTHCDMRIEISSGGVAQFSRKPLGGSTWTYINSGTGLVPGSYNLGSSGTNFKIGIIGYAFGTVGVPFKFIVNSMALEANSTLTAETANYTYTGTAATISSDRVMAAATANYAYTGTDAALTYTQAGDFSLTADTGGYSYSGKAAQLSAALIMAADTAAYAYTGTVANLVHNYNLVSSSGEYTYSGTNASLIKLSVLDAVSGVYAYNGINAALTFSGAPPDVPIAGGIAVSGTFGSGQAFTATFGDGATVKGNL